MYEFYHGQCLCSTFVWISEVYVVATNVTLPDMLVVLLSLPRTLPSIVDHFEPANQLGSTDAQRILPECGCTAFHHRWCVATCSTKPIYS